MSEPVANASFRAALEKVIDVERVALATSISRIRVTLAGLATLWGVRLVLVEDWRAYLPTLVSTVAYLVLSLVVWRLLVTGRLVKSAGWVVPLLDTPMVALAQVVQTPRLPVPWMGMVNSPAMMIAFVVLSSLSLSRNAIWLTTVVGLVPVLYRAHYLSLSASSLALTLLAYGGVTFVLQALVGRVRGLVHASRAQDLLGKYVLGRRIGVGGMAEVFEATYSPEGGFERRVAVKRILPTFADQKEAIALFRQEAEVGAMLAHPGVVQVLDFGTHQGNAFLAMEFIDGVSLRDLLTHYRTSQLELPVPLVTHIAWQLTEALDYIHSRVSNTGRVLNLVHRDLNPPNIMLTHIGDAKLADFGIALVAGKERMTAAGIMRGKMGYASPEQILGVVYDGRADLFALGVTLYEALSGNRLFRGDNEMELMRQCLELPIAPLVSVRPDVPLALNHVIMHLLERDQAKRTASASELRRQLLELPREFIDVQNGRKLLSAAVAKTRQAMPRNIDATSPTATTSASSHTAADVTATRATATSKF